MFTTPAEGEGKMGEEDGEDDDYYYTATWLPFKAKIVPPVRSKPIINLMQLVREEPTTNVKGDKFYYSSQAPYVLENHAKENGVSVRIKITNGFAIEFWVTDSLGYMALWSWEHCSGRTGQLVADERTGWVWEIPGWSSRVQENYRSFQMNL